MVNIKTELSVIIPVSERYDDVVNLYKEYKANVSVLFTDYEFIYVLDGEYLEVQHLLENLKNDGEPIKIVKLSKWFGEATALSAGFENSIADKILTLPAYYQIDPTDIKELIQQLDSNDMAIAYRYKRFDSLANKIQAKLFHSIFNFVTGEKFHDLGCGARAFLRKVVDEIPVYGDQHRFLPVLANKRGFKVIEVKVKQSKHEAHTRLYHPGVYIRRLLDIVTVFFLVKFTKKPLRFFGLIGFATFMTGALLLLYMAFEKIFMGTGLADRPLLLLGSLLTVLGVQVFAIGLIGELIIFTHAKDIKEYTIEKII